MSRVLRIALAFAALALVANAITLSSSSLTSASFNALPGTVFDASVATNADYTLWGTLYDAIYGPGTDNSTVYVYGRKITSTLISTVASRKLNATILSNGTAAANGAATIGTDASATLTTAIKAFSDMAVGFGTMAFAYVAEDTNTCQQLYVTIYTGGSGSATATKQVTSNTCALSCVQATTDGVIYVITPNSLFYDNSTYYVTYTTVTHSLPKTTAAANCAASPGTAVAVGGTGVTATYATNLQGVAATSTAGTTWTTKPTLASVQIYSPSCGPSNASNSTIFYCVWKDAATATANTKYATYSATDGSAGTASGTVATDTTATSGTITTTVVYTFGGFIAGTYQQGFLVNAKTTIADTAASTTYSNILQIYNLTTGNTNTTLQTVSGYSNTLTGGAYSGAGLTYSSGYGLLTRYQSASTNPTYTYELAAYFSNSTINVTKVTVGSTDVVTAGNSFVDANGALWFGAYNLDTNSAPDVIATGTLGKLVAQIYAAGNILASIFALLSLMIAALFAF